MSRGVKVSIEEKADLIEWIMAGKSRVSWAKKHDRAPATVSRLLDDEEFKALWAAAERGQEQRFSILVERAYEVANDTEHMHWPKAMDFLAKIYGRYKPEKVNLTVDRVTYADPDALQKLSLEAHPEIAQLN